jgi:two-component system, LytTR family, response regulator
MRVLIVDDERPARDKLRLLLEREPGIEILGESPDGDAAVRDIEQLAPEVVFLDIRMPKRDGFSVIEAVAPERMPLVVFVTAHDEHALRAFEVHAVDYLLKPFTAKRLHDVLERIHERLASRDHRNVALQLQRAIEALESRRGSLRRLVVEARPQREILLPIERIDLIRAQKNYVELHTAEGHFLRRGTLTELERRLDPELFVRISRSEIVRLDAVREMQPWFHGDYRVLLANGTTLTWTRRYRARRDDL